MAGLRCLHLTEKKYWRVLKGDGDEKAGERQERIKPKGFLEISTPRYKDFAGGIVGVSSNYPRLWVYFTL